MKALGDETVQKPEASTFNRMHSTALHKNITPFREQTGPHAYCCTLEHYDCELARLASEAQSNQQVHPRDVLSGDPHRLLQWMHDQLALCQPPPETVVEFSLQHVRDRQQRRLVPRRSVHLQPACMHPRTLALQVLRCTVGPHCASCTHLSPHVPPDISTGANISL